jgi:hypothetical protein
MPPYGGTSRGMKKYRFSKAKNKAHNQVIAVCEPYCSLLFLVNQ